MLTIFSIPKPFNGHIEVIQRNAIQSWLKLPLQCEVILCGDDPGVAQVASEYSLSHLPNIARNSYGTPLLSSAFESAQQVAKNSLICYVNADIIFLPDLLLALERVALTRFLALGQRWDLDVEAPLEFGRGGWEQLLRGELSSRGVLHPPAGSDYFIFPKWIMGNLPDFAVGRPGWDNWFIYQARALQVPVVDITEVVTVVHQNHAYGHVPRGTGRAWDGPEADHNVELMGGNARAFLLSDATHQLTRERLTETIDEQHLLQRIKRQAVLDVASGVVPTIRRKVVKWLGVNRRYFPRRVWQRLIYDWSK